MPPVVNVISSEPQAPPLPANLSAQILAFLPVHYWEMSEGGTNNFLDQGSDGTLDLDNFVGTNPARNQGFLGDDVGPADTVDWGTSVGNWVRNLTIVPTMATGTFVTFWSGSAGHSGSQTLFTTNSADETDQIAIGFGGRGVNAGSENGHLTCAFLDGGSFFNYRVIASDLELPQLQNNDQAMHMIAVRQSGSGVELYWDGILLDTHEITAGTVPGADTWFGTNFTPTRTIVGNGRLSNATDNWGATSGPIALYDSLLTGAGITALWDYVYTNVISMMSATTLEVSSSVIGPSHFWDLQEAAGNFVNSGESSLLPGRAMVPRNTPTRETSGFGRTTGPYGSQVVTGVGFNGTTHYLRLDDGVIDVDQATGTFIAFLKTNDSLLGSIFCQADNATGAADRLLIQPGGLDVRRNTAANDASTVVGGGSVVPTDSNWHMIAVTQDGAGSRPVEINIDGVEVLDGDITEATNGTGTLQDFFDNVANAVDGSIGARVWNTDGNQDIFFDGDLSCIAFYNTRILNELQLRAIAAKADLF